MTKRYILSSALILTLILTLPTMAKTTSLEELQDIGASKSGSIDTSKTFPTDHWAYKTLEDISKKYNPAAKFDGKKSLSRNEAALLLVNLVGKIEQNKSELNEEEKTEIKILKQELKGEIQELMAKVATLETSVDSLKGRVSNLEADNNKTLKFSQGENFKINGGLQAQFTGNFKNGGDNYPSNFILPFSDLTVSGKVAPHLDYRVTMIPTRFFDENSTNGIIGRTYEANSNNSIYSKRNGLLNEAYVSTDIIPHHTVYLGQTRIPIGYEGQLSPYDLETIDKAQIARNFSDTLDLGVMTKGSWNFVDYKFGVYNGNGLNVPDTSNRSVDLSSWVVFKPLYKMPKLGSLELGGGYENGQNSAFSHNVSSFYGGYKYKKYSIKGEYAFAQGYLDPGVKASGWYIHNAYNLTDKLQLVARLDRFDPNVKESNALINTEYTLGTNYNLRENLILMTGYVFVTNRSLSNSQRIEAMTQVLF